MYKILIKTCSASNNIWNFYQEDGVDYVAASLEDMKPTALTLLKKYGKKNIKIIDQMSGQDMDNADVYIYDSTDNYEELNNRPFINGVEIVGQLSLEDLGIQPAGNYLDQNDLEEIENKINNIDLSAYATNERVDQVEHKVDNINLDNFYTKEETDAKDNERLRGYFWNYDGNSITTGSSLERISKSRYASTFNELSNLWDQIAVGGMHPIEVKDKNNYRAWLMPSGTAGGSTYVVYKYRGQVILNTPSSAADVALYRSYYLEFRVNRSDNKLWEADFLCKEGYEQPSMARVEAYVQEQMVNSSANYAQKDKVLLTDGTIEYTPTSDYHPATKKYVDDSVAEIPAGPNNIIKLTGAYDFFKNYDLGYLRFNDTDLLSLQNYINDNYDGTSPESLLPLNIINNSTKPDYSNAQNIIITDVEISGSYISFTGHIYFTDEVIGTNNSPYAKIYDISLFAEYTETDGEYTISMVGFRTRPRAVDCLTKGNTIEYTPIGDYNPATKKYVDDNIPPTIVYKAFAPNDHTIYLTNGVNIASIDGVKTQLNNFIKDCIKDGNYNKILHLGIGKYNGRYQSYLFTEYEEGIQSYGSDPYVERRYFGCSVNYAGNNPKGQRRYLRTWDLIINVDDTLDEPVKKAILYVTSYSILEPNNTVAYTPTSDYNPATKKYVDDVVANIDVPDVDLSDYYNKTEVDDKLLTVDVNVEGLDIYSDEERVIGRWVDGRPLYQKYIYIGELTNGITDTHLDDYGIKAHEVRFHQVYKMGPDGILCLISPQFMSMAGQVIARVLLYQEDSGVNVLRVATGEGMDVEGHTAYAIVTYTKPDDEILLPTSDYYPATKKYVDDAIAGVSGGSGGEADLTNYYTKAEVDALLQALRDEFVSANNSINDKLETIIYGGE